MSDTFVIFKINPKHSQEILLNNKGIAKSIEKAWRITPAKIGTTTRGLVLSSGTIIGEVKIGGNLLYERNFEYPRRSRTIFELEDVPNSEYVGKDIDWPTSNPASIVTESKLKQIIK